MRALVAAIVALLVAGVAAVITHDEGGPLDQRDAEACGRDIVVEAGLRVLGVSARLDGAVWRISAATTGGVLGVIVRAADGRVNEVEMVGTGGVQRLERDTRLAIFERGC